MYPCAGCGESKPPEAFHRFDSRGRDRPVTSRCRTCRREDYYAARYPDEVCACCMKHRPLDVNGECKKCNEEAGLRQCNNCRRVKPLWLNFYGRSRQCHDCRKHRS